MLELWNASVMSGMRHLLRGVSVAMAPGTVHVIIGPSGSGKSTLLRCLAGLEKLHHGILRLDTREISIGHSNSSRDEAILWPRVTLVFQQLFLWPHMRISENLLVAQGRKATARQIEPIAQELDFDQLLSRYPNEVSVGQRQRVALARAILVEPEYLLLDEITSAQDALHIAAITHVLRRLVNRGAAIGIVTHHIGFAAELMALVPGRGNVYLVQDGSVAGYDTSLDPMALKSEALRTYLAAEARYSL